MPSILPMAVLTVAATAALWGGFLYAYSGRTTRYLPYIALGLPLSAAVNLLVKGPLAERVGGAAGIEPGLGAAATPLWFLLFLFMLSPVFEELIKVLPVVLPPVRRAAADADGAFWTGMALGIGFGIGEVIYLAWGIAASGEFEQYAWYMFTGFLGERLLVVFVHGFMTAIFLWLAVRRAPLLGFGAAMASHALVNSTAMLFQLGLVPGWSASVSLVALVVIGVLIFERVRPRAALAADTSRRETVHYSREE